MNKYYFGHEVLNQPNPNRKSGKIWLPDTMQHSFFETFNCADYAHVCLIHLFNDSNVLILLGYELFKSLQRFIKDFNTLNNIRNLNFLKIRMFQLPSCGSYFNNIFMNIMLQILTKMLNIKK